MLLPSRSRVRVKRARHAVHSDIDTWIADKGRYIMKERELWAERFNIPMGPTPTVFPVRTLGVSIRLLRVTVHHLWHD